MSHAFWLEYLKREHEVEIGDIKFNVFDFPTSNSVISITKECRMDLHKVRDLIPPNDEVVILDLGANIGVWSIWVAKLFPKAVVVAVEPMPHNYDNLVVNIERSGCKNIMPLKAAVWKEHEGHLKIGQHPMNSGSASIEFIGQSFTLEFEAMAHPLDYLVEKFKPFFIKMDIEGAEYCVMEAVKNWDAINLISIDMHNLLGDEDGSQSVPRKEALKTLCYSHLKDKAHLVEPFDIEAVMPG